MNAAHSNIASVFLLMFCVGGLLKPEEERRTRNQVASSTRNHDHG